MPRWRGKFFMAFFVLTGRCGGPEARLATFFRSIRGLQLCQALASRGMERIHFENLRIQRPGARGELHRFIQFCELQKDRSVQRIEFDGALELRDRIVAVLGNHPQAARQKGAVLGVRPEQFRRTCAARAQSATKLLALSSSLARAKDISSVVCEAVFARRR